ncbi:uncharacterized protein LOC110850481 [Folsomia candida]|uniref:uncharacterized protein LOC110850481 n=1 Tax=Folsomia candida TaxID=158441 RepID=UPI001604F247|nr:uncharacterized protein LOC110850481 [Folsomia candida]
MANSNRLRWMCEICEDYLPHEPAIALHILEKHEINILILEDDVTMGLLKLNLSKKSQFWQRVEFFGSNVPMFDDLSIDEENENGDVDEKIEVYDHMDDDEEQVDDEDDLIGDSDDRTATAITDTPLQTCYICEGKFPQKKPYTPTVKNTKGKNLSSAARVLQALHSGHSLRCTSSLTPPNGQNWRTILKNWPS